jgi:hypothetical protein
MRAKHWIGMVLGLAAAAPLMVSAIVPADLQLVRWPDASTTFAQPIANRAPADACSSSSAAMTSAS